MAVCSVCDFDVHIYQVTVMMHIRCDSSGSLLILLIQIFFAEPAGERL